MIYPIHHTFGPHVTVKYFLYSTLLILQPWKWKNGNKTADLRKELSNIFEGKTALFGSGRDALFAILGSLNLENNDEIIIQGYTCAVVPNAIMKAGAVPIYADIETKSLNLSLKSVEEKINIKTRAVICQHTFGIPADIALLRSLCDKHNIILIEDCAHILKDKYDQSGICTKGDVMFFSFGRDKAISGITGGAVIIKNKNMENKIIKTEKNAKHIPTWEILRLLHYPCIYLLSKPLYGIGVGKAALWLAGKTHLLVPYVTKKEKFGKASTEIRKIPNACAALALSQLKKIESINNHRRKLTQYYLNEAIKRNWLYPVNIEKNMALQKFPIFTNKSEEIRRSVKKQNIHLEDGWTNTVICPRSTNQKISKYRMGDCPEAEKVATNIISLPTHPTMTQKQAKRLVDLLSKSLNIETDTLNQPNFSKRDNG